MSTRTKTIRAVVALGGACALLAAWILWGYMSESTRAFPSELFAPESSRDPPPLRPSIEGVPVLHTALGGATWTGPGWVLWKGRQSFVVLSSDTRPRVLARYLLVGSPITFGGSSRKWWRYKILI